MKGWTNTDIYQYNGVDVVHDLNTIPYPFETNSISHIRCQDTVEHLQILPDEFVKECHRILKKGGTLYFTMPYSTSACRDVSPQHNGRAFLYETPDVYIKQHFPHHFVKYSEIRKKLLFPKGMHLSGYILEPLFNAFPFLMKVYDHTFLRFLLPAETLCITLRK